MNRQTQIAYRISDKVIESLGVDESKVFSTDKHKDVHVARMMIIYICHTEFNISVGNLSKIFKRTPRNIFYLCMKMKTNIDTYNEDRELYKSTLAYIKSNVKFE